MEMTVELFELHVYLFFVLEFSGLRQGIGRC